MTVISEIRKVLDDEATKIEWQRGYFLIVDNVLVAHGRMPFEGPRLITLAMT